MEYTGKSEYLLYDMFIFMLLASYLKPACSMCFALTYVLC